MRKRLVVVCAAASAMVLGGVLVANSAAAEETPDVPGVSGWSFPGWSDLFGGFGADHGSMSDGDNGFGDVSSRDSSDLSDLSGNDDGAPAVRPHLAPAGQRPARDDDDAARPDRQEPDQQEPDRQEPDQQEPDGQEPAQRVPAKQAQAPAGAAPAQRPATGFLAAAREDVTSADISSSPSAPVQQQVLALVNQDRRRSGCGDLSVDRRLIDAANEHAADMARRRYFAHESPNGEGAGDRVQDAGYKWSRYGENIARGVDSAYDVVDGWMHSPEHRENILDCSLHQMGVGLAIAGDRTPYWVQDFASPM